MITTKNTTGFQGFEAHGFFNDKSMMQSEKQIEKTKKRQEELLPIILEAHVLALIGTALS
jgi:hypothetical protein